MNVLVSWLDGWMLGSIVGWMCDPLAWFRCSSVFLLSCYWLVGWIDGWMHACMHGCMDGIEWMHGWNRKSKSNRLLLNPSYSKTDFLWCATHRRCNQLSTVLLEVCGVRMPPTGTVRDLGILLEADMQMTCHVRRLVSRCSRQLRLIKSCIRSLPFEAAETAVACFVIPQVDRCNSLLVGAPKCLLDRLQSVLKSAARLVCNRRKYDHVTPLLHDCLHWLPVQYRIDYKLALLVYKSLHGAAPDYLKSYCIGVSTSRAGARLRSEVKGDLKVRKSKTCFGDCAFSVAGLRCRNNIPTSIRSASTLESFKS